MSQRIRKLKSEYGCLNKLAQLTTAADTPVWMGAHSQMKSDRQLMTAGRRTITDQPLIGYLIPSTQTKKHRGNMKRTQQVIDMQQ